MRCHICDSQLANIHFNRLHDDIDPCPTCLEVISNVFTDPVPEEELLEVEPTAEELLADVEEAAYGRFDVI